ncbi:MAG TPA: molybdopterin molybdotransferase MoeA, partial [Acidimicrobiales bacterium]|nr:molybdopterin molybdotransferase MoeA [Acidimicrobiales bacterium]
MITLDNARKIVLSNCAKMPGVEVDPRLAFGLTLADSANALIDVPAFANSAMDGYAVIASDVAGAPVKLRVVGTILAGPVTSRSDALRVTQGCAIRVMTGAPIPDGADSVVMVERTTTSPDGTEVTIDHPVAQGEHVRNPGEDVRVGSEVLPAGSVVGASQIGALVSAGIQGVRVHSRPRVGVLSTGDELVDLGSVLADGQIFDSNRPMLVAMVNDSGCTAVDL